MQRERERLSSEGPAHVVGRGRFSRVGFFPALVPLLDQWDSIPAPSALNGRAAAAGQGGPGAARGAAADDLAGETTQQLISFELELLGHAARGPGRALGEWSCRSGSSAAADLPHRQASR